MSDNATTPAPAPASPEPAAPPKKSSIGRKLLKVALLLVVLLVIGLVLVWLNLNTFVKMGVIRGGKYATSQETGLNAANLSFSQGTLTLDALDIANPKDYDQKSKFLLMKNCAVQVESSSIFTSTVNVPDISIQGLEITLEQNGAKNNLAEIMDEVQKNTSAADKGSGGGGSKSPGKNLKIGKLSLSGTKVHIRANVGMAINMDLDLPPLTIQDPTNPDGRDMKIADLVGTILLQLSKQIVENPQIPGSIKDGMKNVQAIVSNLRGELDKNVKVFSQNIGQLQDAVKNMDTKGIQDAGKNLQDAGKNLGNMFNQNNKQPAK